MKYRKQVYPILTVVLVVSALIFTLTLFIPFEKPLDNIYESPQFQAQGTVGCML